MADKHTDPEVQESIDSKRTIEVISTVPADNWWVALNFSRTPKDPETDDIDIEPVMAFAWCRTVEPDSEHTFTHEEMLPILQDKVATFGGPSGTPYNWDYNEHGTLVAMWRGDKKDCPYEAGDGIKF